MFGKHLNSKNDWDIYAVEILKFIAAPFFVCVIIWVGVLFGENL